LLEEEDAEGLEVLFMVAVVVVEVFALHPVHLEAVGLLNLH
jgi:hypothetical protein